MGEIRQSIFKDRRDREILFRSAKTEDSKGVIRYIRDNQDRFDYMISNSWEVNQDAKYEKDYIEAHALRKNAVMVVAVHSERIVGLLNFVGGMKQRISHDGEVGISVAVDYQGAGIGRHMMEIFITWATENPLLKRVTLHVMGHNLRALTLSQSLGFEVEGRRRGAVVFDSGRVEDLIMMGLIFENSKDFIEQSEKTWIDARES